MDPLKYRPPVPLGVGDSRAGRSLDTCTFRLFLDYETFSPAYNWLPRLSAKASLTPDKARSRRIPSTHPGCS